MANNAIGASLEIPQSVLNKLDEVDKKINLIASDSEKMATHFTSAITRMGNSVDPILTKMGLLQNAISGIDFGKLNGGIGSTQGTMSATVMTAEQLANAIAKAVAELAKLKLPQNNGGTTTLPLAAEMAKIPHTTNEAITQIKNLEKAAKNVDWNREWKDGRAIDVINSRIADLKNNLKSMQSIKVSPEAALSLGDTSIEKRIFQNKQLEIARRQLDTTDANYSKTLAQLNAKMLENNKANSAAISGSKELKQHHSNLLDISGQLARQMALVFSVSQITGYINKMIEVRGNMELQQRALQAILQDKDKANELYQKITDLAVRSPFTIQELTTYTKQLAAYRIETSQIYDTTKMLADVSAGLGVSMDRLILAYGQVKAANYLRGQELRQFSEAGINILGELSKAFTETKGQFVSIGEVSEMVSKRMVKFEDVADVFKRLTSEGGIFYNMQEIQAETLKGQISNLTDTVDLMFNDIGKQNDGTLKNMVGIVRSLVQNWRDVADVVFAVGGAFAAYKSALLVANTYSKIHLSTEKGILTLQALKLSFKTKEGLEQLKTQALADAALLTEKAQVAEKEKNLALQRDINTATKFNGWAIALAAVIGIGIAVKEIYDNTTKTTRELNSIQSQGVLDATMSVAKYKELAGVISDSTASYDEQSKALADLQRIYADILPKHLLEAQYIREKKGAYDEATAAIYNYVQAKTKEKQLEAISSEEGQKITDNADSLAKAIMGWAENVYNANMNMSDILPTLAKFREMVDKGEISTSNMYSTLSNLLKTTTGLDFSELFTYKFRGSESAVTGIMNYFKSIKDYSDKITDVNAYNVNMFGSLVNRQLDSQKKLYEDSLTSALSALSVLRNKATGDEIVTPEQIKQANDTLASFYQSLGMQVPKNLKAIVSDSVTFDDAVLNLKKETYNRFLQDITTSLQNNGAKTKDMFGNMFSVGNVAQNKESVLFYIQKLQDEINLLDGTPVQREIKKIVISAYTLNNVKLTDFKDILLAPEETIAEYSKRIKEKLDSLAEGIARFNKNPYLTPWTKTDITEMEKEKKALDAIYSQTHIDTEKEINKQQREHNKAVKSAEELARDRLSLIKESNKEYERLLGYFDKETAHKKVVESFGDAYKINKLNILDYGFTYEETIKRLENLAKTSSPKIRKIILKEIGSLKTEAEIKIKEDSIKKAQTKLDDLFSGYELGIDIESKGLDKDLFGNLFGIQMPSRDELKTTFNGLKEEYLSQGEEIAKAYDKGKEKLKDIDKKYFQDLIKKYSEFTASTQFERNKIEQEFSSLNGFLGDKLVSKAITQEQYDEMMKLVTKGYKKAIQNVDWKEFQESADYAKAFGDIDKTSNQTIERVLQKLKIFKENALASGDVENAKAYVDQMSKLYDTLVDREDVFESLKSSWKAYNIALQEANDPANTNPDKLDNYVLALGNLDKALTKAQSVLAEFGNQLADVAGKMFGDEIGQQISGIFKLVDSVGNAVRVFKKANDVITKTQDAVGKTGDATGKVIEKVSDAGEKSIEAIGGVAEATGSAIESSSKTATTAVSAMEKASVVLAVLSAALQIFTALTASSNEARQEEIDQMNALVETQIAYNKSLIETRLLHEDIFGSNPFGNLLSDIRTAKQAMDDYNKTTQEMQRRWGAHSFLDRITNDKIKAIDNLKYITQKGSSGFLGIGGKSTKTQDLRDWVKQNLGTDLFGEDGLVNLTVVDELLSNHADRLTDDTKNTLKALKMYAEEIKAVEENINSWATDVFGDLSSNLADALVESFRNGESAADKFKTHVANVLETLGKQMVQEMLYSNVFSQYQGQLEALTKKYATGAMTENEYSDALAILTGDIMDSSTAFINVGNDFLQRLQDAAKARGVDIYSPTSTTELSGLQKGISGVTEDTAQALEALLNSVRFFVADNNSQIKNFYKAFTSTDSNYNPILGELRLQTEQISAINRLLASTLKAGHPSGGSGIKVFLN